MVWAPQNELSCMLFFGRITTLDLPVTAMPGFSIGVQVLLSVMNCCLCQAGRCCSSP